MFSLVFRSSFGHSEKASKIQSYQDVLTAGTKIKCIKIIEHGSWSVGGFLRLYAEIVDGPFQGITAEINDSPTEK